MDKIKTIVIEDGELIQDSGKVKLTNEYAELIPQNYVARYLKLNITFKNYTPITPTDGVSNIVNKTRYPFILINNEVCPVMTQQDFEVSSDAEFQIESLKVNRDIGLGSMLLILVPNYKIV